MNIAIARRSALLLLLLSYTLPAFGLAGDLVFRDGFEVLAKISVSPTPTFPPQLVGSVSVPITVVITNVGAVNLTISEIGNSGGDASDFVLDLTGTQSTLAPTASTTLKVTFHPLAPWKAGTRQAQLNVIGNVSGGVVYSAESGMGVTCGGAVPACTSGCADTDGDGLNDAWEIAGGIDINNDGLIDAQHDVLLPGADPNKPDIYVYYDWMDYGLGGETCGTNSTCTSLGAYHAGETCSNVGQCTYACTVDADCTSRTPATASHAGERCINSVCAHTHDPLALDANSIQPVIDRFAAHGINLHVLRGTAQPHSHVVSYRSDAQMDLSCEGAVGSTVGLGKYAVSFYDLKPSNILIAYHYALFGHYSSCDSRAHCRADPGNTSDCPDPNSAFGQSGIAELSGNDLIISLGGLINNTGRSPHFVVPSTLMHELGHNLGLKHDGHLDRPCPSGTGCPVGDICTTLADNQGQVCHESFNGVLGAEEPNYKPNYLSIMNYTYGSNGIAIAASVGARTQLGCAVDSDCGGNGGICIPTGAYVQPSCSMTGYVCTLDADCTLPGETCVPPSPGYCARLDYSEQTLPIGGATPGALDESHLDDTVGLGSGTTDMFNYIDGLCHGCPRIAPTTGPINWGGVGVYTDPQCSVHNTGPEVYTDTNVQSDVDAAKGVCASAPADVLHGHTDWPDKGGTPFSFPFQCTPVGQN